MEYKQLGNTDVMVPEIGLGAWKYKGGVEPLRRGIELGANLVDTAEMYRTEDVVGQAIKDVRDQVLLATKVLGSHLKYDDVLRAAEASLRQLDIACIDLYQIHFPDGNTPIQETLQTLDDAIRQGKILYVGCSNFQGWQVSQAMEISNSLGLEKFVSLQPEYNLTNREIEKEIIPAAKEYNLGIIPYYPLASGILTGKYRPDADLPEGTRIAGMPDAYFTRKSAEPSPKPRGSFPSSPPIVDPDT